MHILDVGRIRNYGINELWYTLMAKITSSTRFFKILMLKLYPMTIKSQCLQPTSVFFERSIGDFNVHKVWESLILASG